MLNYRLVATHKEAKRSQKSQRQERGRRKDASGQIAVKRNKEGRFAELLAWAKQGTFFNDTTEMPLRSELLLITLDCWNQHAKTLLRWSQVGVKVLFHPCKSVCI